MRTAVTSSPARERAFTFVELMVVMTIMAFSAALGADAISSFEASSRANRAACECLAAFRYARTLATSTGNNACVYLDPVNNTFSVFYQSDGTDWDAQPVAQPMGQGRLYFINLPNDPELKGTTLSPNPAAATEFIYSPLGTCNTAATITFTFGSHTQQLTVPLVGDPQMN